MKWQLDWEPVGGGISRIRIRNRGWFIAINSLGEAFFIPDKKGEWEIE